MPPLAPAITAPAGPLRHATNQVPICEPLLVCDNRRAAPLHSVVDVLLKSTLVLSHECLDGRSAFGLRILQSRCWTLVEHTDHNALFPSVTTSLIQTSPNNSPKASEVSWCKLQGVAETTRKPVSCGDRKTCLGIVISVHHFHLCTKLCYHVLLQTIGTVALTTDGTLHLV